MAINDYDAITYRQPVTIDERLAIAADFVERAEFSIPLVVDTLEDDAMDTYAAWPERLYAIGSDGRIAYKGWVGPFFFSPSGLESWLEGELESGD